MPAKLGRTLLEERSHALAMIGGLDRDILQLPLHAHRRLQIASQRRMHQLLYQTIGKGGSLSEAAGEAAHLLIELRSGHALIGQSQALSLRPANLIGEHRELDRKSTR